MKSYFKPFFYFFYVQTFFKTKKIYLIFFLFTIGTLVEMLNIGIILPFLNIIFNPGTINVDQIFIFNFFNVNNLNFVKNFQYVLIILIIGLFILKSLILILAAKYQASFFAMMRAKITTYFFDLYISKPYIYFLDEKDSSKIIRNSTMISSSYSSFLERFLLLANDFFIFLGVIVILFIYDPIISSIVFFSLFISSFVFVSLTKKYFFNLGQSLLSLSSSLIKDIQETLDNILQIKLLKKSNFFKKQFNFKATDNSNKIGKLTFLHCLPKIVNEMIAVLLLFSVIFYLLHFEKTQEEILIMLTLFAIATVRIIPVANKLITFLNTFNSFTPSLELLCNELKKDDHNFKNDLNKNYLELEKLSNINIKDLSFGYGNRKQLIFNKINLNFSVDHIYGLVGETGSGKTTLLNIITGLIQPTKGFVEFSGMDINKIKNKKISYVSQNTYLQNSSIKKNIAFGCEDNEIDLDKIYLSLKSAKLEKLIKNLPEGIETNISELGANFSGGQVQRLSIARALYADSNLIIFDEPTSSLDEITKKEILEMIYNLKKNKIVIIITHSKTDLAFCDEIFEIKNSNIRKLENKNN